MSISAAELITYGSLSRPQDDVSASGGAVDLQNRPVFTQLLANSTLAYVSSAADTRQVTVTGRDTTGAPQSETITLNGVTVVSGAKVFERILTAQVAATGATQTVTIGGSGVGNLGQIPPKETGFFCMFINSASDPSVQKLRYEKVFWLNSDPTLTLTSAVAQLAADPSSKIQVGISASKNDSLSVANRFAVPGGISFVGVGVNQSVPTNQLEAAAVIGVWILQTLNAGDAPLKSTFTLQLAGSSI